MSLARFAQLAGVSKATISVVGRGSSPSLDTYVRVCWALGVPLETFVKTIVESAPACDRGVSDTGN